jgi:hypothetical protein
MNREETTGPTTCNGCDRPIDSHEIAYDYMDDSVTWCGTLCDDCAHGR